MPKKWTPTYDRGYHGPVGRIFEAGSNADVLMKAREKAGERDGHATPEQAEGRGIAKLLIKEAFKEEA